MSQLVVRYWSCTARSEQGHEVNEEKKREREVESNLKHFAHFRRKNNTVSFGARNFRSFKIGFFFSQGTMLLGDSYNTVVHINTVN